MNKRAKNTIRIIAGQWRGRRLPVLDSDGLRPTIDRVRETVFNWLMYDLAGARCLDLFAGSGVLGLECASRGAKHVDLVEADKRVAAQLRHNLEVLGNPKHTQLWPQTAQQFLSKYTGDAYDLVFLDPPFQSNLLAPVIALFDQHGLLKPGSLIYLERAAKGADEDLPDAWQLIRELKAGQSLVQLFEVHS